MRKNSRILFVAVSISVLILGCRSKSPENKFAQFDRKFFTQNVPEFPGARLLTKNDIPEDQHPFFDEEQAQLQLLHDLNNNSIPDYVICGVADSVMQKDGKRTYFIAMFEQTDTGFARQYMQRLSVVPVNLKPSKDRPGVVISFAFSSEFAAEIYYENEEYHLQRWY